VIALSVLLFTAPLISSNSSCIGSCKSNYHTITVTTAPFISWNFSIQLFKYIYTYNVQWDSETSYKSYVNLILQYYNWWSPFPPIMIILLTTFYWCYQYLIRETDLHKIYNLFLNPIEHCKYIYIWIIVATFNNISVISWRSVLLVEESEVPGENHRSVASHWLTLSHNIVMSTPRH
jgi:hypothetical protein